MIQKIEQNLKKKLLPLVNPKSIILYDKNSIIFNQDSVVKDILILLDGKAKLTHGMSSGKDLTLGIYSQKHIILPTFFDNKNFFSLFRMQALSSCKIGIIPLEKVFLDNSIKLDLLKYYDILIQKIYLQMRDLVFNNNLSKLMSIFIRLSNSYGIKVNSGIKINIELNNILLSEYTGCDPETISRLISKLRSMKIIEKKNRIFIIKNIDFMKSNLKCNCCRTELCII